MTAEQSELVADEVEAVQQYDKAIDDASGKEKDTLEHIRDEELEHIEELTADKQMSADEAWEDFRSNYDAKEFDDAHKSNDLSDAQPDQVTLSGKMDTLMSVIQEIKTDTEAVAQLAPEMRETETPEEALQDETPEEELAFGAEADLFGDEGTEDVQEGEEQGEQMTEEEGKAPAEEDVPAAEAPIEEAGTEEGEAPAEEGAPEEDASPEEGQGEGEVPEEEDKPDELTEKMVRTIIKQSKRIDALEKGMERLIREFGAMKKSMTARNTVDRPRITKRVGVVSKPPVTSGYTGVYMGSGPEATHIDYTDPKRAAAELRKRLGE